MDESDDLACLNCGSKVSSLAKFCAECGQSLTGVQHHSQPPNVIVDEILATRGVTGERKFVTVLFADLKGSTEVAAGLDPEDWYFALERFHAVVTSSVYEFNGVIASYAGDGIAALFGAPIAHEGHAEQACWAALALQERVAELAVELAVRVGTQLAVRVGLNSGEVVVGRIGEDARVDYSAQGVAVHIAARMEQIANAGEVFLAPATAELVAGRFELESVGSREVKGIANAIEVHRLIRPLERSTTFEQRSGGSRARFVGRATEMAVMLNALADLHRGSGGMIRVSAPAGNGKSRLVEEFLNQVDARGVDVIRVFGDVVNVPGPTWIARALCDALAPPGQESAESRALIELLGPTPTEQPVDPSAVRRRIDDLLKALVVRRAQSGDNALVIVIEDVHAIGSFSLATMATLISAQVTIRVLFVLTHRPQSDLEQLVPLTTALIELEPLDRDETEQFVAHQLGADPRARNIALLLYDRTDGNPFFLEETLRSLVESGELEHIAAVALPTRVQTVVAARIDRLNRRARHVLNCAAVIGVEFDMSTLASVAELQPESCVRLLDALVGADLVRRLEPNQFSFRHRITQEVAYESQLRHQRSLTHERVAVAMSAGLDAEHQPAIIADHCERAGNPIKACEWYRIAAIRAALTDPNESYRLWQRVRALTVAVDADSTNAALLCRAEVLTQGARCTMGAEAAFEIIDEARQLAVDPAHKPLLAFVLLRAWPAINGAGLSRDARALTREAIALADQTGIAMISVGARLADLSDHVGSRSAREGLDDCDLVEALLIEGGLDKPGSAMRAQLDFMRGSILVRHGEAEAAIPLLRSALASAELRHDHQWRTVGRYGLVVAMIANGEVAEARQLADDALAISRDVGGTGEVTLAMRVNGLVALAEGDAPRAIGALEEALALTRSKHALIAEEMILTALSNAYTADRQIVRAKAAATEAIEIALVRGNENHELTASLALCRAVLATDPVEMHKATELLQRCTAIATMNHLHQYRAEIDQLTAQINGLTLASRRHA
jgi:class 3 adenylate cyclase/tetratricopeptide (TPR) repeat protein